MLPSGKFINLVIWGMVILDVGMPGAPADELAPALSEALAAGSPYVLDVLMKNNPTPTTGHWNILDIYSPDKEVSHVATD